MSDSSIASEMNDETDVKKEGSLADLFKEMQAAKSEPLSPAAQAIEEKGRLAQEEINAALTEVGEDATIFEIPAGFVPEEDEDQRAFRRVPAIGEGVERRPPPDPWSRTVPELGKVTVTAPEWETFYRNFLLGARQKLVTRIQVMPGQYFECVVQSLTPGEKELLALVTAKILKTHPITMEGDSPDEVKALLKADYWLKLEVLTRVLSIAGSPDWKPIKLELEEDMLPEEYPKLDALVRASRTRFNNNQIFPLLWRSLHLAAVKFTILEDALANRDFIAPADAD